MADLLEKFIKSGELIRVDDDDLKDPNYNDLLYSSMRDLFYSNMDWSGKLVIEINYKKSSHQSCSPPKLFFLEQYKPLIEESISDKRAAAFMIYGFLSAKTEPVKYKRFIVPRGSYKDKLFYVPSPYFKSISTMRTASFDSYGIEVEINNPKISNCPWFLLVGKCADGKCHTIAYDMDKWYGIESYDTFMRLVEPKMELTTLDEEAILESVKHYSNNSESYDTTKKLVNIVAK